MMIHLFSLCFSGVFSSITLLFLLHSERQRAMAWRFVFRRPIRHRIVDYWWARGMGNGEEVDRATEKIAEQKILEQADGIRADASLWKL